jgi:hypothetical protein
MPETLLRFDGPVACTSGAPPLTLTLSGSAGTPAERAVLMFSAAAAPAAFPATLADALIERLAPQRYRVTSGARVFELEARAAHVHFEVGADFYRALPPRRVPLSRRWLFALLLKLAASRAGFALLKRLRR